MATEENQIENWQNRHILKLRDFKEPTVVDTPDWIFRSIVYHYSAA